MARWVELFYDLAFVAAILILSAAAHGNPLIHDGWIAFIFAASWWVWFSTTTLANRFHMADLVHRLLLLLQMLVIVLMAMEARVSVDHESSALAVEYGVLLGTVALIAYRASRIEPSNGRHARRLVVVNACGAVGFLVASTLPQPWRMSLAFIAIAVAVVPTVIWLHHFDVVTTVDEQHLVERMGAFTLIVFGEAFIEVAITVSGATLATIDVLSLVFEFVLVLALFTSYFEDIPTAGLHPRRLGVWAGGHLVAQAGIAATAIAVSQLIDFRTSQSLPDDEVFKLTLPLAGVYLAFAAIGACTRRRPAAPLVLTRVATAGAILVFDLIVWLVSPVHLSEALPVITVVAVVNAAVVVRLRDRTHLEPAPSIEAGDRFA
jgi:low temperature requirement protein LtrA